MAGDSDLFLFGDDLDAILKVLEAEEDIDKYFEESVTEVSKEINDYEESRCKNVMFTCEHAITIVANSTRVTTSRSLSMF